MILPDSTYFRVSSKKQSSPVLLLIIFLLTGTVSTMAQDITRETLVWTATKAMDDVDSTITDYSCTFTTRGSSSVDWSQNNGAHIYSYTVTGVRGDWANILTDGQFTYQIASSKVSGTLVFSRQNGQSQAHLVTSVNGRTTLDYTFYFDSVRTAQ